MSTSSYCWHIMLGVGLGGLHTASPVAAQVVMVDEGVNIMIARFPKDTTLRKKNIPEVECPEGVPPADTAQLAACISGKKLDFDIIPGAGDEQRLMVNPPCPKTCQHGPLAAIQPERKSHQRNEKDLQRGIIIARLFLDSAETDNYRKLALEPGHFTYWWVQLGKTGPGRSVYISTRTGPDNKFITREYPLRMERHRKYKFKQAIARWKWSDEDETAWGSCSKDGCCR